MARLLVLTSPARGHVFPITPTLLALRDRGHQVVVRTLSAAIEPLRAAGLDAEPLPAAVEAREVDDWRARTPLGAQRRTFAAWMDRAEIELGDTRDAIARHAPDALLVDTNAWGATAVAEASGLPLARFHAYPLPMIADGVPPFGPGLPPLAGRVGRIRDRALRALLFPPLNRGSLPRLNEIRARAGAAPAAHIVDVYVGTSPLLLLSAEPFEYPRTWPANVHPVGPGLWDPPGGDADAELLDWIDRRGRPVVLVSVSSEFQNDAKIVDTALEALAGEDVTVVATAAAAEEARSARVPENARVVRFASHEALLPRAGAVVCHAGMGITQKALAHGVPVCAVPFGRDQLEVARRVVVADAGVQLSARRLSPERLRRAVAQARGKAGGAQRVAEGFRAAGGSSRAAAVVEALMRPQVADGVRAVAGPRRAISG
jgi:UDP:flavonoid glycosyltransferase YjiC (YdhE family)